MNYKKIINNQMFRWVINTLFFCIILIIMAYLIAMFLIRNNVAQTKTYGNLVVETTHKKLTNLEVLSDIDGLKTTPAKITVTNNGSEVTYNIKVCQISKNAGEIRIAIDGRIIKNLDSFPKEDNCYNILTTSLESNSYRYHEIKLWNKLGTIAKDGEFEVKVQKI